MPRPRACYKAFWASREMGLTEGVFHADGTFLQLPKLAIEPFLRRDELTRAATAEEAIAGPVDRR